MHEPRIRIRLDQDRRVYEPGSLLSGEFFVDGAPAWDLRSMEISVLWYTEGKGDTDFAIHDFWRLTFDSAGNSTQIPTSCRPARLGTILPDGPLSYRGLIVKLRWCMRVRGFGGNRGREEIHAELPFQLGRASAARLLRRDELLTVIALPGSPATDTSETGF